jgi:hypothetical protein
VPHGGTTAYSTHQQGQLSAEEADVMFGQRVADRAVPARRVKLAGAFVDRITQRWVIATGRPIDLTGSERWLDGPIGNPDGIGTAWAREHADRVGADVVDPPDQGLLPTFSALSPSVEACDVSPRIVLFYETTAAWSIDVWSRWARWAEPGGRLLNSLFAHRLRQLSLPLDPLQVADGMDSWVAGIVAPGGHHLGTVWQRTLRATGATIFGGFYDTVTRPGATGPSIRVVFPLPNGSLTVLLRPTPAPDGGLVLSSGSGRFGDDGAYLVVRPDNADHGWARRVPLHERFSLTAEPDGSVRCDHQLDLGPFEILRLRYRVRRDLNRI